jgi:DNA-binding winged helix-turn-helix (wHTH) protein
LETHVDSQVEQELVRFASFEIDLASLKLRDSGVAVHLGSKPMEALLVLLHRPGEVISREEFRDRLWGANAPVDVDLRLDQAIKRIREALNDHPREPRFIETVPNVGFRFMVEVDGADKIQVPTAPTDFGRIFKWAVPAAVVLILVAVWAFWTAASESIG